MFVVFFRLYSFFTTRVVNRGVLVRIAYEILFVAGVQILRAWYLKVLKEEEKIRKQQEKIETDSKNPVEASKATRRRACHICSRFIITKRVILPQSSDYCQAGFIP